MKVILQPEAINISNRQLAENQRYLINVFDKVSILFSKKLPQVANKTQKITL